METFSRSFVSGFAISLALSAGICPAQADPQSEAATCARRDALQPALAKQPDLTWDALRTACEATIVAAKASDPIGHGWFVNAGNGFLGVPLVVQKILPDLAPEIWGTPEDFFGSFGLFPDPDITDRILPRGLGITGANGRPVAADGSPSGEVDYSQPQPLFVTLACGACHTGQIDLGDRYQVLDGAPNTQFDVRKWRGAFSALREGYLSDAQIGTAEAPGETTQKLLDLVAAKPAGYFARGLPQIRADQIAAVDQTQRAIFAQNAVPILSGLAQSTGVRAASVALQTRPGSSYGHGDRSPGLGGHSAGQSDGSGDLLSDLLAGQAAEAGKLTELLSGPLPEALPRFATVTDIPAVWNQGDRSVGQWDGSVLERFWRNIAAELPIIGVPAKVDLMNAGISAEFLLRLPPAPYPFEVDLAKAAAGEALFAENCGTCHRPRNEARYPVIGTDMNRAQVLNPAGSAMFLAAFQAACHDPDFGYTDTYGRRIEPCTMPAYRILRDTTEAANQGYLAPPLDGIWARAPYLHNGSVPTLAQLLKPASRAPVFLRGVIEYDPAEVGWRWQPGDLDRYKARYPTVSLHDTARDGWSNRGHDRDLMIEGRMHRLDWSDPALSDQAEALIEYLKTR
ncbi:hypothetical protein DSD19_08290 [Rhodovulum sp. BSW8]|uniref:c-type cytochrome n=1 Tax=Rhodovulum sp. BSW8 TaxID=2259645 RepID=UPI000DE4336B|nr:hypothetical protein [Rhodovulum sp. BSW8]RBO53795.1 hypothetical protein DSD19_08290 [Rhodovulum sp. BSW8]